MKITIELDITPQTPDSGTWDTPRDDADIARSVRSEFQGSDYDDGNTAWLINAVRIVDGPGA